jgi:hypothetical protein
VLRKEKRGVLWLELLRRDVGRDAAGVRKLKREVAQGGEVGVEKTWWFAEWILKAFSPSV